MSDQSPQPCSARLSEKQRDLLQTVADLPPYMPGQPSSLYWGNIPEHIWFTFRSENAVRKWMANLVARGFLRLENDFFYYITAEGREAIGQNDPSSATAEEARPQ